MFQQSTVIKRKRKVNKFFDFALELKNLWNMKVTVISIVIGALGMVLKDLKERLNELETRRRIEMI